MEPKRENRRARIAAGAAWVAATALCAGTAVASAGPTFPAHHGHQSRGWTWNSDPGPIFPPAPPSDSNWWQSNDGPHDSDGPQPPSNWTQSLNNESHEDDAVNRDPPPSVNVPEPGAFALLLAALAALGFAGLRRRREVLVGSGATSR